MGANFYISGEAYEKSKSMSTAACAPEASSQTVGGNQELFFVWGVRIAFTSFYGVNSYHHKDENFLIVMDKTCTQKFYIENTHNLLHLEYEKIKTF